MAKPSPLKALIFLFSILPLTGCSISKVMRVENREIIPVEMMVKELRNSPLIFAGERHDSAAHHQLQLQIIKALQADGKTLAIGMEMFEAGSQRTLDGWSEGKVAEGPFQSVFESNWRNLPWRLYRDILIFARDHRIPVIGLNAPRDLVRKVAKSGFSSLTDAELSLLPPGMEVTITGSYLDFISSAYALHGRNGEAFRYLCEAQMLRNKVMARRINDYLSSHPATVMVVLAGGGHAREQGGIPAELHNVSYKIVLPTIATLTSQTVSKADGDYLLEEPFWWLEDRR